VSVGGGSEVIEGSEDIEDEGVVGTENGDSIVGAAGVVNVEDVEIGVDEVEGVLGTENGDETGGGEGRGNSKISTTFEKLLFQPPPKNILF
jgi:hypothetical protein